MFDYLEMMNCSDFKTFPSFNACNQYAPPTQSQTDRTKVVLNVPLLNSFTYIPSLLMMRNVTSFTGFGTLR